MKSYLSYKKSVQCLQLVFLDVGPVTVHDWNTTFIQIGWLNISEAEGFLIEWSPVGDSAGSGTVDNSVDKYDITGLTPGTLYQIAVAACRDCKGATPENGSYAVTSNKTGMDTC